ncbi:MAG: hypothetical protein WCI63_04375 [bacterium]
MNILYLEQQPCIRALKYAIGLKKSGDYRLVFGYSGRTLTDLYGEGDELFDRWEHIDLNDNSLLELILSENFDLIHSHNAPDFLTAKAIGLVNKYDLGIPVIQDNHDVISMRQTLYSAHPDFNQKSVLEAEYVANTFADAKINVTSGLQEYVQKRYAHFSGPEITFNNYVPQELIPYTFKEKLSAKDHQLHLVYEGTIDPTSSGGHYDLFSIFSQIASQGIHIHIYTTRDVPNYEKLAEKNQFVHFHGKVSSRALLYEITQYDFGWAGFNSEKNKTHLDVVLANKVMEYIVAGLPVITLDHKTQKEFLKKTGLGITVDPITDLKNVLGKTDINLMSQKVMSARENYTVEGNISQLIDFYKLVIKRDHMDKEKSFPRSRIKKMLQTDLDYHFVPIEIL